MNPYISILQAAEIKNWCVTPYCTTCGAREYRRALARLAGPLGGPLTKALCVLEPRAAMRFSSWDDALEIALRDLPFGLSIVLDAWLPRVGQVVRFDDVVFYRIVRHLRSSDVRNQWIEVLVPLAIERNDFSLIESLLLTLRRDAVRFPALVATATTLAERSDQMSRVLRNCGLSSET